MVLLPILLPVMMVGLVLAVVLAPVAFVIALVLGIGGFASTILGIVTGPFVALLKVRKGTAPEAVLVPRTITQ